MTYAESLFNKAKTRGYTYNPAKPIPYADTKELYLKDKSGKPVLTASGEKIRDDKLWLKLRNGIGGSAVSTVFEENPWTSGQQELDRLLGVEPEHKEEGNTLAMTWGSIMEDVIRNRMLPLVLENQLGITGCRIGTESRMFRHGNPEFSFAIADIDGWIKLIDGSVGIVEIKTTNARSRAVEDYWLQGVIPPYYERQVRHYMGVMNLDFAYVICVWGSNLETDCVVIRIDRDLELETTQFLALKTWWEDHVIEKKPIDYTDIDPASAMLSREYIARRHDRIGGVVDISDESILDSYLEAQAAYKDASDKRKAAKKAEDEAADVLAKAELILLSKITEVDPDATLANIGDYKVYIDAVTSTGEYDVEQIKEKHPDEYDSLMLKDAIETKAKKTLIPASIKAQISDCLVGVNEPTGKVKVSVKAAKK